MAGGALAAGLAARHRLLHCLAAELRREVGAFLAVLRLERVEPDDRGDAVVDLFERARGRPAAVGMRDEADILQVFPVHQIDDVGDVGVEDDVLAEQMRAVAIAGERRRIDLVAVPFENVGAAPPAPAAMPGAVNEHESLARVRLRHRLRPSERRDAAAAAPSAARRVID